MSGTLQNLARTSCSSELDRHAYMSYIVVMDKTEMLKEAKELRVRADEVWEDAKYVTSSEARISLKEKSTRLHERAAELEKKAREME